MVLVYGSDGLMQIQCSNNNRTWSMKVHGIYFSIVYLMFMQNMNDNNWIMTYDNAKYEYDYF